ncbi:class IV adenylate cyclase [Acidobacteriota bacterium]
MNSESNEQTNRNVEIKARTEDIKVLEERATKIADSGPFVFDQEDTFFHSQKGRLKLRKFSGTEGELIFYARPNTTGPSQCRYILSPTTTPDALLQSLTESNGIKGVIRKRRILYLSGQTRIHLDEVENLGQYVELEVVLRPGQKKSEGIQIANDMMEKLGISEDQLIEKAYIDLLLG